MCCAGTASPAAPAATSASPVAPALVADEDSSDDSEDGGGFFTAAQVERGRASYLAACDECHAASEFRGEEFEWKWRRQNAWQLFRQIVTTMPENEPGKLAPEVYAEIVAYFLSLNDYRAGEQELLPTQEALQAIPLGAGVAKTKSPG